jgi:cytochrome b
MPPENKKNGDRFDRLLKDALKQYRQPVPAGFPQQMLSRLQQFEQQEVLRKVVRQERALLAAFVLLPIAGVILVLVFPNLLLVPTQLLEMLYLLAKETAANMIQQWQLWIGYAMAAAAAVYGIYEVLLTDN